MCPIWKGEMARKNCRKWLRRGSGYELKSGQCWALDDGGVFGVCRRECGKASRDEGKGLKERDR